MNFVTLAYILQPGFIFICFLTFIVATNVFPFCQLWHNISNNCSIPVCLLIVPHEHLCKRFIYLDAHKKS